MGEGSEGIAARSGSNETKSLSRCEAHHVSIGPQENRRCSKSKMGQDQVGAEENGVVAARITCSEYISVITARLLLGRPALNIEPGHRCLLEIRKR
jgi:hypothetical protein